MNARGSLPPSTLPSVTALHVVAIEYIDALAHGLGRELRCDDPSAPSVGQTAGFLLRHAMELYDELEGNPFAVERLRALIARGVGRGSRCLE